MLKLFEQYKSPVMHVDVVVEKSVTFLLTTCTYRYFMRSS